MSLFLTPQGNWLFIGERPSDEALEKALSLHTYDSIVVAAELSFHTKLEAATAASIINTDTKWIWLNKLQDPRAEAEYVLSRLDATVHGTLVILASFTTTVYWKAQIPRIKKTSPGLKVTFL